MAEEQSAADNQPNAAPACSHAKSKIQNRARGFTILEIIISIIVLSVLTAAAVPMVRNSVKRQRELDLRQSLRQLRQAIDRYIEYAATHQNEIPIELKTPPPYCPKDLKILEGFERANTATPSKVRFIRKIPIDPMTDSDDWGKRSYKDDPTASSWGGEDVFDVHSKSDGTALNGTKYKDW
jgi:general secretion pathway protein G